MPVRGRKPPEGKPVRHRVKPVHEWTEVEDVPFEGAPKLRGKWPKAVRDWWRVISRMPHCVLWDESDWMFALQTVPLIAAYHDGELKYADAILRREKVMGTTADFRRDLRIRYVEPKRDELPAGVKAIEDYRRRLQGVCSS